MGVTHTPLSCWLCCRQRFAKGPVPAVSGLKRGSSVTAALLIVWLGERGGCALASRTLSCKSLRLWRPDIVYIMLCGLLWPFHWGPWERLQLSLRAAFFGSHNQACLPQYLWMQDCLDPGRFTLCTPVGPGGTRQAFVLVMPQSMHAHVGWSSSWCACISTLHGASAWQLMLHA